MAKELFKETFNLKDTNCTIISDSQNAIHVALESIKHNRQELELYVMANPKFLHSLTPVQVPEFPIIARIMSEASNKAGVGPMAAVAGAIADLAVKDMTSAGSAVAIVENGGEIMAISNQFIDVAVVAGEEPLSKRFGFRLMDFPIGLATSSGRFSHAFSYGEAEAAIVFCNNATLADAAATAVCNIVTGENAQVGIQAGIDKGSSIEGVKGLLIIYRGQVGIWGKTPKILKVGE